MQVDWVPYVLHACAHVNLVLSHLQSGLAEQLAAVDSTAHPCWHIPLAVDHRQTLSALQDVSSE